MVLPVINVIKYKKNLISSENLYLELRLQNNTIFKINSKSFINLINNTNI